jgi:hypothetical protein
LERAAAGRLNNERFSHCPRAWPRPWQQLDKSTNPRSVVRIEAFAGRHGGVTESSATGKELFKRLDTISS